MSVNSHGRRTSYPVSAPPGTILSVPAGVTSGDVASTDTTRRGTSVGGVSRPGAAAPKLSHHTPDPGARYRSTAATLYKMYDCDDELVYVGITTKDFTRIREHARLREWWTRVVSIDLEHFSTFDDASVRERELVAALSPEQNKQHKPRRPR